MKILQLLGNNIIVELKGKIIHDSENTDIDELFNYLDNNKIECLILDLSNLEHIDSYGVASFLRLMKKQQDDGYRFALAYIPNNIMRTFKVTGLLRVFDILNTEKNLEIYLTK